MARLIVLSNGHGEDLMASLLARRLRERAAGRGDSTFVVAGFPIVGEGLAYLRRGIPIEGVQRAMPSGGFILKRAANLAADLRAGLIGLTLAQIRALKALRSRYDAAVALGDVFCLWLASSVLRRPSVFVPTAKSEYISGHFGFEYRLMRRAVKVFPRDEATAQAIRRRGIDAEFVGNLMMDALDIEGIDFFAGASGPGAKAGGRAPVVALLPGSREDAYENAADLASIAASLPAHFKFLLSLAPGLDPNRLKQRLADGPGAWSFLPPAACAKGVSGVLARAQHRIVVVQGCFGDVLASADIVVGLAGTANEQAVGLGKPVVAFPGRGTQFTKRFAGAQKRLLGESLSLVDPQPAVVAREVEAILADPERYARMSAEGRRRMGPPGGLDRLAEQIERLIGHPA